MGCLQGSTCVRARPRTLSHTFTYIHPPALPGALEPDGDCRARGVACFKLLNSFAHVVGYAVAPLSRCPGWLQLLLNVVVYAAGVASTVRLLRAAPVRAKGGGAAAAAAAGGDGEEEGLLPPGARQT